MPPKVTEAIQTSLLSCRETPFGGTIAHGFLTLSMLSAFAYDALPDIADFNILKSVFSETASMRERRKNFRVEWNSAGKIYDRNGRADFNGRASKTGSGFASSI